MVMILENIIDEIINKQMRYKRIMNEEIKFMANRLTF